MRSAAALLKALAARDIRIRAEDDRLIVDAPKGSIDEALGGEIRAAKVDLLEILREAKSESTTAETPVLAVGPQADGCLSPFQERIWMLEQIRPESGENNLPGAWSLRGKLNRTALQAALSDFVDMHPMLRTRFFEEASRVTSQEDPKLEIPLQRIDFSSLPEERRNAEFQQWLEDMARIPFDLSSEPPLRLYLARLGPQEHAIYAVSHSIAWDGWCFDILLQDMGLLYRAHCLQEETGISRPALRYEDFAYWQRARGQSERAREDLLFWQQRLYGGLRTLPIPTDHPRSEQANHAGARFNFSLSDNLVARLSDLARSEGVTVYMLLLSIWSILVGRMANESDVTITTPVRGRDQSNLEGVIGPFTNTLFLRIDWKPGVSFREMIRKVKEISLEAMSHQACPVDDFLRAMPGELKDSSLFQINFSYQNTGDRLTHWGELEVEQIPQDFHATHSELNLWVRDAGDTLSGAIDYRTDLYEAERIEKIIGWLLQVLERTVSAPDQPISQHSLLTEKERGQLREWNHARPGGTLDPDRLTRALEIPATVALESERGTWDRGLLHARSLEITRALLESGVKEGDSVAIKMQRSPESIIALLGVLRAGACWAPIPSSIPEKSINDWIEQIGGRALLHDSSIADRNIRVPSWSLDSFTESSCTEAFRVSRRASSAHICQLVGPVSSSTQSITLETLEVVLESRQSAQGLGPGDRYLMLLCPDDPAFAPAVLSALASGATLATPTENCAVDELRLRAWIMHLEPTSIETGGALLYALPGATAGNRLDSLWIHGDLTQRLQIDLPTASKGTWHVGGSLSTGHWGLLFPRSENPPSGEPLAGGPAPSFESRVIDSNGLELPPGIPGQLVLSQLGDTLPFNTPWRAVWTLHGDLNISERQDGLVWAQGGWIDIPRLQKALQALSFVDDAHLEARPSSTGDSRLITWVAYNGDREPTSTTLRNALARELKDQSLGGIILPVDNIPRDKGGAVRSRVLPDPSKTTVAAFEAPQSAIEKTFAHIWQDLLGVDRVSVHDSFAELGGTSLQALRVIQEVESLTGWSFSPRLLFFQTLRQIAMRAPREGKLS
ncbi:MAG: condensation domain-containing protein [Myxococcota bacterium]|nr:condensation domain-containing protein [Myxococcota bacterium]